MVFSAERHEVWDDVLEHLHYRLDQFLNLMEALQSHRLSLNWFTERQIREIQEAVKILASHAGHNPLTFQLADYSLIEVSCCQPRLTTGMGNYCLFTTPFVTALATNKIYHSMVKSCTPPSFSGKSGLAKR